MQNRSFWWDLVGAIGYIQEQWRKTNIKVNKFEGVLQRKVSQKKKTIVFPLSLFFVYINIYFSVFFYSQTEKPLLSFLKISLTWLYRQAFTSESLFMTNGLKVVPNIVLWLGCLWAIYEVFIGMCMWSCGMSCIAWCKW